jgi:hypothetical protein
LRTIHDRRYLIVDTLNLVTNTGHSIVDAGHTFIDTSHFIVNDKHIVHNFPDFAIDGIRDLQELRRGHSSFLLRQPVQSLQCILYIAISDQFL